ncbi:MAG: iron ABC transporter permease [Acidimicrobiales bacterium]|nr:iron ABC transporter permease [Acidimicrobiales bacterium]
MTGSAGPTGSVESSPTTDRPEPAGPRGLARARPGSSTSVAVAVLVLLAAVLLLSAGWHITQGTSSVGLRDLLDLVLGNDTDINSTTRNVLFGSRIPRLAAAITVGFALGVAGALFQSLSRNAIASPETLGVTAGAYFAVALVAAFGLTVPYWASGSIAFIGGLAAAALVLAMAGGAGASTTRLVLAGSAVAMALQSASSALLILFEENTTGLFAWGSGSLNQLNSDAFRRAAPVVVLATVIGLLNSRRLDLLGLGDDTASVMGVPVRSTRTIGTLLAVMLTASAVTLAGPIGFAGLLAPVLARLAAHAVAPALLRHALLIPAAGLVGSLVVVLTDVLMRGLIGADEAIKVPTGVTTTLFGCIAIIALARRSRDAGPTRRPPGAAVATRSRLRFWIVVGISVSAVVAIAVVGLLAGHNWLQTGDIALWLDGNASRAITLSLNERAPRVFAALLAGAALALSGSLVQASCRNPLAEPGLLGITGGAGLAAVIGITQFNVGVNGLVAMAVVGSLVAFAVVYALAWKGGLQTDRLVLIGIGTWYGATALSTYFLVRSNPWDTPRIYTWLSGTTYGRNWDDLVPVAVVLLLSIPLVAAVRRDLDLLALDDDAPRLAGIRLERVRLIVLAVGAVLAATSVVAVGVVGFVGLVAPHAARALVGGRHSRVVPVAVLLGAVLLGVADTIGRIVIAPAQLPAGLVVAMLGTPYFVFLLSRSRTSAG